ncbi:MAG: 50S ribosomal protein L3, partial [Dehalococcoidia bacterium]
MKRWNFAGGPASHGAKKHRGPGSVGAGTSPGKTWRGQKMGGHMGARRKTVRNLLVVQVDVGRNLILVQGSVPGPNGGLVSIQPAVRSPLADYEPPEAFAPDESAAAPAVEADDVAADAPDDVAADAPDETAGAEAAAEAGETTDDSAADETPEASDAPAEVADDDDKGDESEAEQS